MNPKRNILIFVRLMVIVLCVNGLFASLDQAKKEPMDLLIDSFSPGKLKEVIIPKNEWNPWICSN